MSDSKKYYYLKLKENFFQQEHMIVIEALPNGYIYSNILMKMYLRSLKFEGKLMITEKIPYDPDKPEILAKVLGHDVAHLKETLRLAEELDLVKILQSGEIFMTDIQNFIGHSSTEADRVRAYRKEIKNTERRVARRKRSKDMTNVQKKCTDVQEKSDKNTPELDLELEIDKKKERKKNLPAKRRSTKSVDPRFKFGKDENGNPTLCQCIEDSFIAVQKWESGSYARERKEVRRIAGYAYDADPDDPAGYCGRLLHCLLKIKKNPNHWLKDTPFRPSGLSYGIYLRVKEEIGGTKLPDIDTPEDKETSRALAWYFGGER